MEASDADVVARARDGDMDAYRTLVERHARGIFGLAWRMTGSEQDAEDIVQETLLKAYRSLHRYESRSGFGTWLHRIAANCALDHIRARQRRLERQAAPPPGVDTTFDPIESAPALDPSPDRLAMSGEVRRRLQGAMGLLTPNERAAFVLRHCEEVPIEEIGRLLGLRENATKQSIFRAVRKLRRALAPLAGRGTRAEST